MARPKPQINTIPDGIYPKGLARGEDAKFRHASRAELQAEQVKDRQKNAAAADNRN